VGCALIGGETAEMPGTYQVDDYDLVGFIVGVVEKTKILKTDSIASGDVIIGVPSNGLHTNGYSLVRNAFNIGREVKPLLTFYKELGRTLGEELLEPHRCYYSDLQPLLPKIKGLAHITGGGFEGNIPRILPQSLSVHINKSAWEVPPIFKLIQDTGKVDETEMYHVFNMGIGMVVICSPEQEKSVKEALPEGTVIGKVVPSASKKIILS
jgi:phosphoribosylformylglycinamidine cyclo-ligase